MQAACTVIPGCFTHTLRRLGAQCPSPSGVQQSPPTCWAGSAGTSLPCFKTERRPPRWFWLLIAFPSACFARWISAPGCMKHCTLPDITPLSKRQTVKEVVLWMHPHHTLRCRPKCRQFSPSAPSYQMTMYITTAHHVTCLHKTC